MNFKIKELERDLNSGIVKVVHFSVEQEGQKIYGSCGLNTPEPGDEIIPFDELNEAQIIDWLINRLKKTKKSSVTVTEQQEDGSFTEKVVEEIKEETQLQKIEKQLLEMVDLQHEKMAQGLPF